MATRSFIGKLQNDGTIRGIYCHNDGYYEHTGVRLEAHYTDPTKVDDLLALGDISILGDEIGEKHDFDDNETHRNWTKAYHRDRGEDKRPNKIYNSLDAMQKNVGGDLGVEYAYVYDTKNQWNMYYV